MYIRNNDTVLRKAHGSVFLIDLTDNYSDNKCRLFELNPTGEFIWNALTEPGSIESITELLFDAIIDEVDKKVIFNDVKEFVSVLERNHFLTKVGTTDD